MEKGTGLQCCGALSHLVWLWPLVINSGRETIAQRKELANKMKKKIQVLLNS